MEKEIEEKRCVLCNKPYNYKYFMFGRGCLDNMYSLLGISKSPRFIWNKELYLCTRIAWKNHKFFLNKNQKYNLAQKYIALCYLNKMECEFLDDIKEQIKNDINSISIFSRNIIDTVSFSLNDIYKLYNYWRKFNDLITDFQNINWKELDKQLAKEFIEKLSFIFDETKMSNPILYRAFYWMQYQFWQIVVIGGLLADMKLSARLLNNSLAPFGKEPDDLIIDDKKTINSITESKVFKEKIKEILDSYGKEGNIYSKDYENTDIKIIKFEDADLLLALHKATMLINGIKNEDNTWNLDIEINDTYDFTEFKSLKEYVDEKEKIFMDIFATILNNFGVVSSKYGVIKIFDVKVIFHLDSYKADEMKVIT